MYCSFNSKYNNKKNTILLSFFWFSKEISDIGGVIYKRTCSENEIKEIHKNFISYSLKKIRETHDKITFILPKVDENNVFYGIPHIPSDYVSQLSKDPDIDAHNNKIMFKNYNQVDYMYDFMSSLFFYVSEYTKSLLNSDLEETKKYTFSYDQISYYVNQDLLKRENISLDNYITIFTDASFDNEQNSYGWGGWIKETNNTYRIGGYGFTKDNNHGEMYAILFSIEHLISLHEENILDLNEKIISLTTDSDKCISLIKKLNPNDRYSQAIAEAKSKIFQYSEKYNFQIKYKGIKSHLSNSNNKNAVNNWCDKEAKRQLNIMREKVNNNLVVYVPSEKEQYGKIKNKNKKRKKYLKSKNKS